LAPTRRHYTIVQKEHEYLPHQDARSAPKQKYLLPVKSSGQKSAATSSTLAFISKL
jgi:hypothetical protein